MHHIPRLSERGGALDVQRCYKLFYFPVLVVIDYMRDSPLVRSVATWTENLMHSVGWPIVTCSTFCPAAGRDKAHDYSQVQESGGLKVRVAFLLRTELLASDSGTWRL